MSSDQSSPQDRPASGQPGGLAPELLAGVMDPAALVGKLKSLEQERIANSHDLDNLGWLGRERMSVMPRTRPPYPPEFRREAVQLVRSGRSVKDVAESLGCSDQS